MVTEDILSVSFVSLQTYTDCGCINGEIFHTNKMRQSLQYCGKNTGDVVDIINNMNCSSNSGLMMRDEDWEKCECRRECTVTEYK